MCGQPLRTRKFGATMPLAELTGQRAQAGLAPQLLELRNRYGRDPLRLQTEIAALYQLTTDAIRDANPGLVTPIQAGQVLMLPRAAAG